MTVGLESLLEDSRLFKSKFGVEQSSHSGKQLVLSISPVLCRTPVLQCCFCRGFSFIATEVSHTDSVHIVELANTADASKVRLLRFHSKQNRLVLSVYCLGNEVMAIFQPQNISFWKLKVSVIISQAPPSLWQWFWCLFVQL